MELTPRDYQIEAHDAVIAEWKRTIVPCLVEAATGAGKSLIIAMLAETLHTLSKGRRVLCLAHTSDLVQQNAEKFAACGVPFSIYSASIAKDLSGMVIFATEGSFKAVAKKMAGQFAGVILDEAHRIVPTVIKIIDDLRAGNENLRVVGLSATPYRLGTGFVVAQDPKGKNFPEHQARDPYFGRMVYSIQAPYLIKRGYLTPPVMSGTQAEGYDTSGLKEGADGAFSRATVEAAFEGWGRKTAAIVDDVLQQAVGRSGVMWFAATVQHAKEIMASLPPETSRMIGGDTNTKPEERKRLVADYKAGRYRHLVSVGTMTTGVDFTHVDCIAILRATESVSLMQQIIGRGLRLHPGKSDCLVLDYGGNITRHCPDGNIFKPEIEAQYQKAGEDRIEAKCEWCGFTNLFTPRPNDNESEIDENGYFVSETGARMMQEVYADKEQEETKEVPIPAHFGRRCYGSVIKRYQVERCGYFWTFKECHGCGHENDISARYCQSCKTELVNPNDKLEFKEEQLRKAFAELIKDKFATKTHEVVLMETRNSISKSGEKMVVAEFCLANGKKEFIEKFFFLPEKMTEFHQRQWDFLMENTSRGYIAPRTITYKKDKKSGFNRLISFNEDTDKEKLEKQLSALKAKQ